MPRLFSGIEIPRNLGDRLASLRSGLPGARWIDPENYHFTLRFIGDVDDRTAREFADQLATIRASAFELTLGSLGSFGGRKPRAIWAGIEACEPLAALQRANEHAARAAGLEPESRKFSPHITLARLRGPKAGAVAHYLESSSFFSAEPFEVQQFVLYSARASRGGGPYVVEEAFPLGL
jgi:2'-5' RNA ligase